MKKIIAIVGFFGIFAAQTPFLFAAYFNTTPLPVCERQITKTLQIGSDNNEVYLLQNFLVNNGYLHTSPNGYFGKQTAAAVRAFQYNNELASTGVVGVATRNTINERLCDFGQTDNSFTVSQDGYSQSGVTYVSANDPFVTVVSPIASTPSVYATPQNISSSAVTPTSSYTSSQIAATGIVYNPSTGYTYGIIPQSGSVTVSSPVANSIYKEGDTIFVNWSANNIKVNAFSILLESTISGQSTLVAVVGGPSYSFVLSKELLDSVCSGVCNNNQQGSFRVVVTMPTTDIAGITSTLRAAVAPITIKRPLSVGKMSLTVSKSPVGTGEGFRLYVNGQPFTGNQQDDSLVISLTALCPSSVTVSLAGAGCGKELVLPYIASRFDQGVPVMITNPTWYSQDVTFKAVLLTSQGQPVAAAETKTTVNASSFGW